MKTFLEKGISEYRTSYSFKSYVPSPERLSLEENGHQTDKPPILLAGEIIVAESHSVLLYESTLERDKGYKGILGKLFVTNFRLFLVPNDADLQKDRHKQINLLTGEYGVSLTNIDTIYQVTGDKARKLNPGTTISTRVKGLRIVCKNMRLINLNFEQSDHGTNIVKTILHHAFPGRHSLLFAYDYSEPEIADDLIEDVVMFTSREEWLDEVKRTCPLTVEHWRVTTHNENFHLSSCLPKYFVVPKCIVDCELASVSGSFRGNRPPTWSWSSKNGAALIRMADVLPTITERVQENKVLEFIRKSHPTKTCPKIFELDKELPSVKDIQTSFVKLRDLCSPATKRQFNLQDSRYYSLLDDTKWLNTVSAFLRIASAGARRMLENTTVVLQESNGRDASAVVGSLIQIMLDPHNRTILGFQSLIQKEWVALGHPFCTRLGFVKDTSAIDQQSPVFLLFLDCVWQLQEQFPKDFEFSETYLTSLFDSCHVSIFDTFLFDCELDRLTAANNKDPSLRKRSVWNWRKQFSAKDLALFRNPLYHINILTNPKRRSSTVVLPFDKIPFLEIWSQCYFRWSPRLTIPRGGRPFVDALHQQFRSSINACLTVIEDTTHKVFSDDNSLREWKLDKRKSISIDSLTQKDHIDNFYPFSCDVGSSSNLLTDNSTFLEFDSQSVLNLTE